METENSADFEVVALNMIKRFGEDAPRQAAIRAAELAVYGKLEDSRFWALIKLILLAVEEDSNSRCRFLH